MLHKYLVAFALAATTLAAAGCGGSSKAGSTSASAGTTPTTTTAAPVSTVPVPTVTVKVASGKPLARARWIVKGDAICARFHAELEAVHVKRAAELPRVLPQVAAYERAEVVQLARLVPPASKASDWQQFLNATLQEAEASAKLVEYARLGDAITRTPLAATMISLHNYRTKIAKRDDFKKCSLA